MLNLLFVAESVDSPQAVLSRIYPVLNVVPHTLARGLTFSSDPQNIAPARSAGDSNARCVPGRLRMRTASSM